MQIIQVYSTIVVYSKETKRFLHLHGTNFSTTVIELNPFVSTRVFIMQILPWAGLVSCGSKEWLVSSSKPMKIRINNAPMFYMYFIYCKNALEQTHFMQYIKQRANSLSTRIYQMSVQNFSSSTKAKTCCSFLEG